MSRDAYVNFLKEKFDCSAIKRLNSTFATQGPKSTWDNVTIKELKKLIITEFGNKEPNISSVVAQFWPDSLKKGKYMKRAKFYQLWK